MAALVTQPVDDVYGFSGDAPYLRYFPIWSDRIFLPHMGQGELWWNLTPWPSQLVLKARVTFFHHIRSRIRHGKNDSCRMCAVLMASPLWV